MDCRSFLRSRVLPLALCAAVVLGASIASAEPPALPELGVEAADITAHVTEAGERIGAYVLGTMGVFLAIVCVGVGLRWTAKMIRGRA
jgi:uncharacterized YccA/Bax inhibitor family protein